MEDNIETHKKVITEYFSRLGNDYWKTISEISSATRLEVSEVLKIISTSGEFVRSSYRERDGEPLFTSRQMFREKAPFVDKMIGAFKNRID